ncbi:MAG: SIS domain-containing protein [Acidimicrobiales bacterium]
MSLVLDEIAEQPEVIDRLLRREAATVRRIAADVERTGPPLVVTAARGTSDNAARYAEFLFGWRLRLPVALATPSLHTLYGTPPRYDGAMVIGISQSGASPDVVSVVEEAARQGCLTVAITNEPDSPMGRAAAHVVDLGARPERAVAATKTYTASLAAVAALVTEIAGDADRRGELARTPDLLADQLGRDDSVASVAAAVTAAAGWMRGAVIGRGANYGTAFEVALKIKELTSVAAEPYSPADFLHGPVAQAGPAYPVLALAPSGPTRNNVAEALDEVRRRGARPMIVSDDPTLAHDDEVTLPLVTVPEWLSPMVAVIPGQLLAVGMAEHRGLDVDAPFGLSKVTRTR